VPGSDFLRILGESLRLLDLPRFAMRSILSAAEVDLLVCDVHLIGVLHHDGRHVASQISKLPRLA